MKDGDQYIAKLNRERLLKYSRDYAALTSIPYRVTNGYWQKYIEHNLN